MSQATVNFHLPAPALRRAISTYYVLRIAGSEEVEDIIHPEWANVRLILSGRWRVQLPERPVESVPAAAISGTLERGVVVRGTPGIVVGVGVLPEGWVRLTGQSADGFADRWRPLSDAFGDSANDLVPALRAVADQDEFFATLDQYFTDRLTQGATAPPVVREAHAALISPDTRSVEIWAATLSLSARQLDRLCLRYFGLLPKRLLRRQRFLRTLAAMRDVEPGGWSGVIDANYVDQPHFIREFHYYLGMSPSAYFARPQPFMRQAGDRRKALLGSPVQGLHAPAPAAESPPAPRRRRRTMKEPR